LNDVVSAIERWVQKSNEDAQNVFLWMCFFCNNQYRIQEEAPKGSRGMPWQSLQHVTTPKSQFTSVSACDHCFTDGQGTTGGLRKSCAVDASSRPSILMFFDR
jgi:hypothetical protein